MKIYSDILESKDLWQSVPLVCELEVETIWNARKKMHGWKVHLTCATGRYWTNSQGSRNRVRAASWDQWGIFIDDLFMKDPEATIGQYNGYRDFIEKTTAYIPKGMQAPWLELALV
jgi:hypothetical protein